LTNFISSLIILTISPIFKPLVYWYSN